MAALLSRMRLLLRRWLLYALAAGGRSCMRRAVQPPRRILVIKPDHLGDVLLSTPALHLLRQQYPQSHIVALVGPWSTQVLARNPDIDAVLTCPFPGFQRTALRHSLLSPYWLLLRSALLLRAGHFDSALLLRDDHWWGAALALLAGIPQRVGHAVPECRPLLTHALPWLPEQHVTRQALAVVQTLRSGGDTPAAASIGHPALRFTPAPEESTWADTWLAQQGIGSGQRLIIIHAGTGGAAKLWLPARWAAVASTLTALPEARVLLTGGTGEEALVQHIAQNIHPPPLTLVGSTSVGQLAALLARAALVLGVDSGPLHLAVSQGTPSLHLFGPGNDARFGPWGDTTRHVVLRTNLWCSPCGVFPACPRGTDPPECMELIGTAAVSAAAQQLLNLSG